MRNDNVLKENVTQVSGKLQKSVIEVQQKYVDTEEAIRERDW